MTTALDMSLDDIIKNRKKSAAGRRGRGEGSGGAGPSRRLPNRSANRSAPYSTGKELFSEVGDLKRYSINYDRSGRSKGTAEIVLSRRADALAAVEKYNNVQLDGKLMKIEIVGMNIPIPAVVPQISNGVYGNSSDASKSRPRGGRRKGRGRRRGKGRSEPVSAAALDADLDKYHHEAMQTN